MSTQSGNHGVKPTEDEVQKWWQWLLSIPWERSPLHGGNYVSQGQRKAPTWCLVCTGGRGGIGGVDPNRRLLDASTPRKDILIPVHVAAYTKEEVTINPMAAARNFVEKGKRVLKVNGRSLKPYYIETGPFKAKIPKNHICDSHLLGAGEHDFHSAGYWLKIPHPRQRKKYNIRFGGSKGDFKTEVNYQVTVK